jgi:hypothetical protein
MYSNHPARRQAFEKQLRRGNRRSAERGRTGMTKDGSENGKSFPKKGKSLSTKNKWNIRNRDSACAFEPTRRVAGGGVSFHASFTYVDALT